MTSSPLTPARRARRRRTRKTDGRERRMPIPCLLRVIKERRRRRNGDLWTRTAVLRPTRTSSPKIQRVDYTASVFAALLPLLSTINHLRKIKLQTRRSLIMNSNLGRLLIHLLSILQNLMVLTVYRPLAPNWITNTSYHFTGKCSPNTLKNIATQPALFLLS